MYDKSNTVYLYDGSFDGLLCCIFEGAKRSERPAGIIGEGGMQEMLFELHTVTTQEVYADRVRTAVKEKISPDALRFIKKCFLTELQDKELLIFDFVFEGLKRGRTIMNNITAPGMYRMFKAVRALENEAELL